jgi:predicted RNA-binding protein
MSFLDSVEHDPKQLSMLVYFGMDVISKSLISEHLQQTIYGTKKIKPVFKIRLYLIDERNWISEWAKLK